MIKITYISLSLCLSSVQLLSHVQLFATPWTAAHQASLSITNSWSLPKLTSIELVMSSNQLILCCPLLLPPSIFPSFRVFSNESGFLHQVAKVLELQLQLSPSNEYSGLISFRIDWFDLLVVQGTLKTLLLYHSSNNGQYLLEYFINKVRTAKDCHRPYYFIKISMWF